MDNPLVPPAMQLRLRSAVRASLAVVSACVPEGAVLLSMVDEVQAPLRALQFARVRELRCLMSRVVSLCWNHSDAFGACIQAPPSAEHLLGTDGNGRDLLVRIFYGGRISLTLGLAATLVAVVIGVAWGATAGYVGGAVDGLMMRAVDVLYALPFMFFVILLMVFFGRDVVPEVCSTSAVSPGPAGRAVPGAVPPRSRVNAPATAPASSTRSITGTPWRAATARAFSSAMRAA